MLFIDISHRKCLHGIIQHTKIKEIIVDEVTIQITWLKSAEVKNTMKKKHKISDLEDKCSNIKIKFTLLCGNLKTY